MSENLTVDPERQARIDQEALFRLGEMAQTQDAVRASADALAAQHAAFAAHKDSGGFLDPSLIPYHDAAARRSLRHSVQSIRLRDRGERWLNQGGLIPALGGIMWHGAARH